MLTGNRTRAGVVLLEAMVALLIFGIVTTGFLSLTRAVLVTNARSNKAEEEIFEANRLMEFASLWPTEDLTRRFGARVQGRFTMTVSRKSPTLFEITISNDASRQLLQTVVYRPCCGAVR